MREQIASTISGRPSVAYSDAHVYSFAGFSAADVLSFRSPFLSWIGAGQLCIAFLDATVRTADDMDYVEKLEAIIHREVGDLGAAGDLLAVLDDETRATGKIGDAAIFACRLDVYSGALVYGAAGQSATLIDQNGSIRSLSDPSSTLFVAISPQVIGRVERYLDNRRCVVSYWCELVLLEPVVSVD
ncbi:MAG: hypothetical protein ACKV22_24285 [Bryobacteraceae bacterium]